MGALESFEGREKNRRHDCRKIFFPRKWPKCVVEDRVDLRVDYSWDGLREWPVDRMTNSSTETTADPSKQTTTGYWSVAFVACRVKGHQSRFEKRSGEWDAGGGLFESLEESADERLPDSAREKQQKKTGMGVLVEENGARQGKTNK